MKTRCAIHFHRKGATNPPGVRARGGFTLTEVMVSGAVMLLAMGSLFTTFTQGMRNARAATQHMYALHAARIQMERLKNVTFHDAALVPGTHAFPGGYYTVADSTACADTRDVAVTVEYVNPGATSSRVTLTGSISRALH